MDKMTLSAADVAETAQAIEGALFFLNRVTGSRASEAIKDESASVAGKLDAALGKIRKEARKQAKDGYIISRRGLDTVTVALVGGALFARNVELVSESIDAKVPVTSEEAADLAQKAKDASALFQEAINAAKETSRV